MSTTSGNYYEPGTGTLFSDGVPSDIEPSHYVTGLGSYYVKIPARDSSRVLVILIALAIVVVILLVAWGFFFASRQSRISIVTENPINSIHTPNYIAGRGVNQTVAYTSAHDGVSVTSSSVCNNSATSTWNNLGSICTCNQPYWGGTCQRESYKPQYISVGTVTPKSVTVTPIGDVIPLERLSYPDTTQDPATSCTDLCDADPMCSGVLWDRFPTGYVDDGPNGICTLFSKIAMNPGYKPIIDLNVDANLYVKNSLTAFDLKDRVVVYSGIIPRWWLGISRDGHPIGGNHFIIVNKGMVYNINWYPEHVYNVSGMTGLFSLRSFAPSEFDSIVANPDPATDYVARPGSDIRIPLTWVYKTIFIMYDHLLT